MLELTGEKGPTVTNLDLPIAAMLFISGCRKQKEVYILESSPHLNYLYTVRGPFFGAW